ncbi:MAG TPA: Holliday junction branch migration protein RuvA [Candidatus Paceibacterota bacterium]|jgi:Holliday junction DNA helicase RuvA|nr:Holliday junction branch migration protein RuvA [Candidatus Paceibacterota bacterium]
MLYSAAGKLASKSGKFIVLEVGGLGLKIATSEGTLKSLPAAGAAVKLFCHLHVREDALDLYGFASEGELNFFEMLISVSGVGPRSALSIMDVAKLDELSAAIKEGRPDLMTRASGIGRKTAERIIVELRTKVQSSKSGLVVEKMEGDADILEALTSLGYRREEARAALAKVDPKSLGMEERLKAALALLSKK